MCRNGSSPPQYQIISHMFTHILDIHQNTAVCRTFLTSLFPFYVHNLYNYIIYTIRIFVNCAGMPFVKIGNKFIFIVQKPQNPMKSHENWGQNLNPTKLSKISSQLQRTDTGGGGRLISVMFSK